MFQASDLYQEMADADDVATAERSSILSVDSAITLPDGTAATEHFYRATVTYHIDLAGYLTGVGVSAMYVDEISAAMGEEYARFYDYIDRHGGRDLLDKWLPGKPTDIDYELKWDLISVKYVSFGRIDLTIKVSERWLTPNA